MSATASRTPLRRDTGRGMVGGVLAGFAERLRVDPVLLRVGFVAAAVVTGGLALLAYLVAWAAMPAEAGAGPFLRLGSSTRIGVDWRIAAGLALLVIAALLGFRQLGVWWSDAIVWPIVLAGFGAALLWARSRRGAPGSGKDAGEGGRRSRLAELYSGAFGVLLVIGAALLFLSSNNILGGLRDAAFTTLAVLVALALILAPFLWRLGRSLAAERAERIRSQERAEMAAHLHDSVLQTLTLMQKRSGDPREVAKLARRQERQLREWLNGEADPGADAGLAAALRSVSAEVEDAHGVRIELVVVGDCPRSERAEALLGAAREALVNAAKHAGESPEPIRAYAEVTPEQAEIFVHDRGPGFDPDRIPADRRGVRESIVGRMDRHGGRAVVHSSPGAGTEIELVMER
jgi:signal transduction histidine kinase/phage shock protein PspC (stress-responsive transcriptional regulator)